MQGAIKRGHLTHSSAVNVKPWLSFWGEMDVPTFSWVCLLIWKYIANECEITLTFSPKIDTQKSMLF